jgi:RimJ/RimL family protein N-acetyltransferase
MINQSEKNFDPQSITLTGRHVRLEPIGPQHAADLYAVGGHESIWRYLPRPAFENEADAGDWIEMCIQRNLAGERLQFAVINRATGRAIGSTGYLDIDRPNRALEIGMTWYGVEYQRTAVNTECKYLLLRHAFDDLGALRVCLKTDSRNERSQRAIERIGAQREGTLRNHRITWDGANRHSVYFSIIESEWPSVCGELVQKLAQ